MSLSVFFRVEPFFSLVSKESLVYLKVSLESQDVSRVFQGCFKGVLRMFQGYFTEVSRDVSRKFQGCFKKVSREFHGSFKGVSGSF